MTLIFSGESESVKPVLNTVLPLHASCWLQNGELPGLGQSQQTLFYSHWSLTAQIGFTGSRAVTLLLAHTGPDLVTDSPKEPFSQTFLIYSKQALAF